MPEKEISWSAPEFEHHQKDARWYLASGFFMALFLALAIWQGNFLFAIFVAMAGILFLRFGAQAPHSIEFRLTDAGLEIAGKNLYSYETLFGFAINRLDAHDDGFSELILKKKHRFGTYFKALIPNSKVEETKIFVNKHLPEIEYEASLVEHLSRFFKF
ncbi:MAG: hypothetical protein UY12_C0023G0009 [Parcubacteria group bacterium GW2011_GWA2_47_8b]|uniref:DUF5673 domain-containing protein n=2 Tax=Parcubacteria group TaxID=1794811 RepID=A0A0G1T5R5_9BACT|nr:MAG: hypothetical protein UY02_C0007G0023 [Candidatus Giovannonibacteria bacterium GW2011_GWB1_47_6b]KKU84049.1 MAG: hypothetical protein UY12_C0023G0009 [Parcubacteria group bacterium GW2011_GWA2_47_8b]KKU94770.1 MAG: hypothetical protein UY24_C0009G0014 [Parcubacteria group bacterium GW2011_GWA1_48_11b]OGY63285.1 MAG: hypothetical protein A3E64_01415 [Candidatus Harrisonbacteria bacterium RIFCSPHIGHO2_12_FULL_48_16]